MDNQLNLALAISNDMRERTSDLDVGFDPETNTWELIVRHTGNLAAIGEELGARVVELHGGYGIVVISEDRIDQLVQYEEIIFIEKPKRLEFAVNEGRAISCINPLQNSPTGLFGKGILIAVIDSG